MGKIYQSIENRALYPIYYPLGYDPITLMIGQLANLLPILIVESTITSEYQSYTRKMLL